MNSVNSTTAIPKNGNNNLPIGSTLNNSSETSDLRDKERAVSVRIDEMTTADGVRDKNDFVNLDDINVMTRTNVGKVETGEEIDASPKRRTNKPANYAAKKTVAQGMIDIALLTSNANQLKNLIEFQRNSTSFWFVLFLIVLSLIFQISVGIALIFKGRYESKGRDKNAAARVNKWVMAGVFSITIINVFIAVFSTGSMSQPAPAMNVTS